MAGKKSTAMVKWDARLAEMAAAATKTESSTGGGGNFISVKGGILTFQGATMPDNKMQAIVLHSVLEKAHYATKYDPNNPSSPDCYAFGTDADDLVPHEAVEEPYNETCTGCPNNAFGSADTGKGKACGDLRRLALIAESDFNNIEEAELAFMKLPYYSTLEWAAYVRLLNDTYRKPPMAFKTEISVVPDPKSQFRVKFRPIEELEGDEIFEALEARFKRVQTEIIFPYSKFEATPEPVKRAAPAARPARAAAATPVKRTPMPPPTPRAASAAAGNGKPVSARRPARVAKF